MKKKREPKLITVPYKQRQFILRQREREARTGQVVATSPDIRAKGVRLDKKGEIKAVDGDSTRVLARFSPIK